MNRTNDAQLLSLATTRMEQFDPATLVSQAEVDAEFGFTKENLAEIGEIEF